MTKGDGARLTGFGEVGARKVLSGALSVGCVVLLAACGTSLPPQELKDARSAYQQAKASPAAELAPAKLDNARQALEEAEAAFEDDAEGQQTKDLAYVAQRRALIAHSAGNKAAAEQKKKGYEEDYEELERKRMSMTKEELEATRKRLERERQRAAAGEEALARTEEQLEQERAARKAAEVKLGAAIASLKEMGSVKEEARGVVITLSGSVLFATGKHELLPLAKEKLNEVAVALKDQGYKKILIEGHTDSRGSKDSNESLSLKRANSVKAHLVSQGLDSSKIETQGLGEERPIASNDTADGRANNRRVELVVTPE